MTTDHQHRVIRPLADILPSDAATLCEEMFLSWIHEYTRLFEFEKENPEEDGAKTRFVRMVSELVTYAQGHLPEAAERAHKNARLLLALAHSSFLNRVEPDDPALERINPYASELGVICSAALGRYRIEVEKRDVPDAWFAALMSIKVESVRSYLCRKGATLERVRNSRHLLRRRSALDLIRQKDATRVTVSDVSGIVSSFR